MNYSTKNYLVKLWNQHEQKHRTIEDHPVTCSTSELAEFLVAEKVRIARLLLDAGFVNKGYIDSTQPDQSIWIYDPDEAAELTALVALPFPPL